MVQIIRIVGVILLGLFMPFTYAKSCRPPPFDISLNQIDSLGMDLRLTAVRRIALWLPSRCHSEQKSGQYEVVFLPFPLQDNCQRSPEFLALLGS